MDFQPRIPVRLRSWLLGATTLAAAGALLVSTAAPGQAVEGPDRRVVGYTVRPGDTATGLAVRFHAWTDELIRINHLGPAARLYVGDRIRIPVVVARARQHTQHHTQPSTPATQSHARSSSWRDPSRAKIRRLIIDTARRHDVDPCLALAISWQEAGWQMHHTSHAGAIGAMQVMPDTGVWMSLYAGRRLDLRSTRDNVTAGVLLIRVLRDMTHSQKTQIAAYYQGIGSVQRGVLLAETRHYVANVKAIKRSLHHGWNPA
jgi:soluble lytic murein transglycosylase-like protein